MTLEEIISNSVNQHATDVHLEHTNRGLHVYQRRYGTLHKVIDLPIGTNLINRIKMRSNLDLSETRRTQEGQFLFEERNRSTFIRVSIISTVKGEKVALRLLPDKNRLSLNEIGIQPNLHSALSSALDYSSGLILVCGATGAGKSTTLYSCLDVLNTGKKTIFTIEDPVEYEITGLFQCEPNPAIGLDSATLLKSFLRQDPDVIMVGEVRDAITANLAVNAALTGHLVLATLHTNSALDAIHRCHGWQVDFFSLASSLKLIIHQSMHYKSTSQHPVFHGISPLWETSLPKDYDTLISSPSLWEAYPHLNSESKYAMV
ncbi:GspE/PulE family protein [Marinomonas foliarum]|jgi:general secretion pathway protein E|uniref:Flp pilus assembly complex ATPase component TadA n=1 Tax=Marinomonas foliarum TaxID=491950 RepID=A0A368ZEL9_9GAMM|nr:ATPase, T2SS/T4P/T4SS family [Marinomonas foliarum]QRV24161.1 Flp pilus assembly complex ATPase component TadA [Marinomonas foliarum]RCW91971.1 general secretion pathway protein E [Marinomonas foliarum]